MALVAADLATAIASSLSAQMTALYPQSAAGLAPYHAAIASGVASAVVAYLTANSEVLPSGSPALNIAGNLIAGKGRIA